MERSDSIPYRSRRAVLSGMGTIAGAALAAVTLLLSIYWMADGMRGGEINGCPVDL